MKIAAYMATRSFDLADWENHEVCVNVVAIVPARERRKDVDNMAKGLLDVMEGSVYPNDRLIEHLSIRRAPHDEDVGWYKVRIMPVLDTRADVIDPQPHVGWGHEPEIIADGL